MTLPWREDGSCGPEPLLEATPAHHVLGIAAAIARHLPRELVFVIASAHLPPMPGENYDKVCGWVKAAGVIATGEAGTCPAKPPIEAFVNHFSDADFARLLENGLRYTIKVPVKKPGDYQLRVAVLDEASDETGSANELVEVPDLNDGRLALSGIVLSGKLAAGAQVGVAPTRESAAGDAQAASASGPVDVELEADPSVRRLRPGMELHYDFIIYNAQAEDATGRPRLQTQVRLFRDGQLAYEGKPAPFDTPQQEDLKRLRAGGSIKLSRNAAPGDYVLQIIVTDLLAKESRRVATQWIDFEITR